MTPEQLRHCLDSFENARPLLQTWELRDCEVGQRNLAHMVQAVGIERVSELSNPLGRLLPRFADPGMSLNNLERFLANAAGAEQLPMLLENRARAMETLLQLFSPSQFFSDLLILNPDYLDTLRIPLRSSPSRAEM